MCRFEIDTLGLHKAAPFFIFTQKERCTVSSFENLRVVDNFYQTSLFFPMPTVVISTLCEN